jgi:hypothetical protein
MIKNFIIGILTLVIIAGAAWYYYNNLHYTPIGEILKNPRDYDGKTVTISGEVKDRISLVFIKYFMVQDNTGEIFVITGRAMPLKGSTVRVKGTVQEAYSIGDEQMIVLVEEYVKGKEINSK